MKPISKIICSCSLISAPLFSVAQTTVFTESFVSTAFKDTNNTSLLWTDGNTMGELSLPKQNNIQTDFSNITTLIDAEVKDSSKVIVADINNNKWPDLLFLDNQNTISLQLNEGAKVGTHNIGHFSTASIVISSPVPIYDFSVLDFDSDGDQDIVTVTSLKVNTYSNDDGQFALSEDSLSLNLPGRARVMTTGDWDNDGDDDIVIAYDNLGLSLVMNAQGVLEDDGFFDTTMNSRFALFTKDINLDGIDDLISGNFNAENTLYLGRTNAPLNGRKAIEGSYATRALAAGDLNNDGNLDIWDAAYGNSQIMATRARGASSFQVFEINADENNLTNDNSEKVLIWDMDKDGDLDSIELQNGFFPITLWEKSDTDRSLFRFSVKDELVVNSVNDIALADVNRDDFDDLIIARNGENQIRINAAVEMTPTITSSAFQGIAQSTNINTANQDVDSITLNVRQTQRVFADIDYAISVDGGETFLAIKPNASLVFTPTVTAPDIRWQARVKAQSNLQADILSELSLTIKNTMGEQPPIITAKAGALSWWYLFVIGVLSVLIRSRLFIARCVKKKQSLVSLFSKSFLHTSSLVIAVIAPSYADDLSDIVSGNIVDDGYMVSSPLLGDAFFITAMAKGDFDGDGDNDIVVGNQSTGMQVFINLGDDTQAIGYAQHSILPYSDITALDVADVNGDGRDDIAFTTSTQIFYLQATSASADMAFDDVVRISNQGFSPRDIKLLDIDNDSDIDMIVANRNLPLAFYLNNGAADFAVLRNFVTQTYATEAIAVGDINGDGVLDIALANQNEPTVVLYQDALDLLTFDAIEIPESSGVGTDVLIKDINEDNKQDITIAYEGAVISYLQSTNTVAFESFIHFYGFSNVIASASLSSISQACQNHIVFGNTGAANTVQQFLGTSAVTFFGDEVVSLDDNSAISNAIVVDNPDNDDDDDIIIAGPGGLNFYHNRLSELSPNLCATNTFTTLLPLPQASNIDLTLDKNGEKQTCTTPCYAKAGDTLSMAFDIQSSDPVASRASTTAVVYNSIDVSIDEETTTAATASYTFVASNPEGDVPVAINLGQFGLFDFPQERLIFDNTPPETPSVNVFTFDGDTLTLTAQSNEDGQIRFVLNASETTSTLDLSFSTFGTFDVSNPEQFPIGESITVSVIGIDKAGNESSIQTLSVTKKAVTQAPITTAKAGVWRLMDMLLIILTLARTRKHLISGKQL